MITLKDVAEDYATFADGAAVGVSGKVKVAFPVKPAAGDWGPYQGFVLVDGSGGELSCQLKAGKVSEVDQATLDFFAAGGVKAGQQVFVQPHSAANTGRPAGTKLRSYSSKAGKKVRVLDIFGVRHIRSEAAAPPQPEKSFDQQVQATLAAAVAPDHSLTEEEACQLWLRNLERLVRGILRFSPETPFDRALELGAPAATSVLIGTKPYGEVHIRKEPQ